MAARTAEHHITAPALRVDWLRLAFVHWPCPPEAVQRLLPPGLTADRWAGRAWVSLTPFTMSRVRLAGAVPAPGVTPVGRADIEQDLTDAHVEKHHDVRPTPTHRGTPPTSPSSATATTASS